MTYRLWVSHDKIRKGAWWVFADELTEDVAKAECERRMARSKPECRFVVLPEDETPT